MWPVLVGATLTGIVMVSRVFRLMLGRVRVPAGDLLTPLFWTASVVFEAARRLFELVVRATVPAADLWRRVVNRVFVAMGGQ